MYNRSKQTNEIIRKVKWLPTRPLSSAPWRTRSSLRRCMKSVVLTAPSLTTLARTVSVPVRIPSEPPFVMAGKPNKSIRIKPQRTALGLIILPKSPQLSTVTNPISHICQNRNLFSTALLVFMFCFS